MCEVCRCESQIRLKSSGTSRIVCSFGLRRKVAKLKWESLPIVRSRTFAPGPLYFGIRQDVHDSTLQLQPDMKMPAPKGDSLFRSLNPQAQQGMLVNGDVPGLDLHPGSLLLVFHMGPAAQESGSVGLLV